MSDRHKLFASAAFYILALAAQVSGFTSHAVAGVLVVIATGLLIAPACHHLPRMRWPFGKIPLREAAQIVFDATRHGLWSEFALKENGEDPKVSVANAIIHTAPTLEGRLRGATKYDRIPMDNRNALWTDAAMKDAGRMLQPAKYYDIRVKRSDLKAVIASRERIDKAML